ncbi:hypothetical protein GCM10009672_00580 [Nesterenkonia lutea]
MRNQYPLKNPACPSSSLQFSDGSGLWSLRGLRRRGGRNPDSASNHRTARLRTPTDQIADSDPQGSAQRIFDSSFAAPDVLRLKGLSGDDSPLGTENASGPDETQEAEEAEEQESYFEGAAHDWSR